MSNPAISQSSPSEFEAIEMANYRDQTDHFESRIKQFSPDLETALDQILQSVDRLAQNHDSLTRQADVAVIRQAAQNISQQVQNDRRLQNPY